MFEDGEQRYCKSLIIALGTSKRWLGLNAEKMLIGAGVSGSASCDGPQFINKEVVVVGGGDAALEEALALTQFAKKVTIIYRSNKFNANAYLQERIMLIQKLTSSGIQLLRIFGSSSRKSHSSIKLSNETAVTFP